MKPDLLQILRDDSNFASLKTFVTKYAISLELVSVGFDGYAIKYYMTLDNHDSSNCITVCNLRWRNIASYFESDIDLLFELCEDGFTFHDKKDIMELFEKFAKYCQMKNANYRINRNAEAPQHTFEIFIDEFVDAERMFLNFFTIIIAEFQKHSRFVMRPPELDDERRRTLNMDWINSMS